MERGYLEYCEKDDDHLSGERYIVGTLRQGIGYYLAYNCISGDPDIGGSIRRVWSRRPRKAISYGSKANAEGTMRSLLIDPSMHWVTVRVDGEVAGLESK